MRIRRIGASQALPQVSRRRAARHGNAVRGDGDRGAASLQKSTVFLDQGLESDTVGNYPRCSRIKLSEGGTGSRQKDVGSDGLGQSARIFRSVIFFDDPSTTE